SFFLVSLSAVCTGIAFVLLRWDRVPAAWLHAVPVLATIEVALGVRFAGVYGDIATNYYIFVVLFVGYAFCSRRAIAGHVAFASAAASLRLLYADPRPAETAAPTLVTLLVLVVVA